MGPPGDGGQLGEARVITSSPGPILAAVAAVFVLILLLLARGGSDPREGSGERVAPRSSPAPTGGRLIYAVPEGDGWARLWRWNLVTDEVRRGPRVPAPFALVNVRSPTYGWLGITSDVGGSREAAILEGLDVATVPRPIGAGDLVTWTRRGSTVLLVDRGPVMGRCRRTVDVAAVDVEADDVRTVLRTTVCGDVLSVGRTSVGYFMTVADERTADVVGFGYEDAGVLLPDHGVIDVAPSGQMLVTPAQEFLPAAPASPSEPPPAVTGAALRFRLFEGAPVDLQPGAVRLRILEVLAYTDAGTRALVIATQGPDRPALWEVSLGIGGIDPELPQYLLEAWGITEAAFANDGTAFVLTNGRLHHLRDHRLTPLELPHGAPRPAGPLAWIVREPTSGITGVG
ncbi:MAG TPA: hypothetical protein VFZ75_07385 [Actinomycetota bacterium]|nr:hypothetical protein [Actinomycetota bacterium]